MGFINKGALHRDGFIQHISTSMPDPPPVGATPLRMGLDSSPCPWKAENNTHCRSSGDTKLGDCCTKPSGDTNLSWELPARAAPASQKSLLHLAIKRSAASAGHQGFCLQVRVCLEFVSLKLLCSGLAVFRGGKKNQTNAKHRALRR